MGTLDAVYRKGVEWIAKNVYTLNCDPNEFCFNSNVQMLAELTDTAPAWIVQCVDRCAHNRSF